MDRIARPCPDCPNAMKNQGMIGGKPIRKGEGHVIIGDNGYISYCYLPKDGSREAVYGDVKSEKLAQSHPDLADNIDNCVASVDHRVVRDDVLGMVGLTRVVRVCPALNLEFDPKDATSVADYFSPRRVSLVREVF